MRTGGKSVSNMQVWWGRREGKKLSTVIPRFAEHRRTAFCLNRNNSHGKFLPSEESSVCLRKHPMFAAGSGLGEGEPRVEGGGGTGRELPSGEGQIVWQGDQSREEQRADGKRQCSNA